MPQLVQKLAEATGSEVSGLLRSGNRPWWTWAIATPLAVALSLFLHRWLDRLNARWTFTARNLRGIVGKHRLTLTDSSLLEEGDSGRTETHYGWVGPIVETEKHAYVYLAPAMAHVIPKARIVSGDWPVFRQELDAERNRAHPQAPGSPDAPILAPMPR